VTPAGLHHAHVGVGEVRQRAPQHIHRRHEVGVEDADELTARSRQAGGQGARFEPGAVAAMNMLDVEAAAAQFGDGARHDIPGAVGGIVEHLDLQPLARIVDRRRRLDEAFGNVHLVEQRKLYSYAGPLFQGAQIPRRARAAA